MFPVTSAMNQKGESSISYNLESDVRKNVEASSFIKQTLQITTKFPRTNKVEDDNVISMPIVDDVDQ